MKEIGGYFGLEQLISNEYHKGMVSLNNGRNALLYILKARSIKKIYIPYYLCSSVSDMLSKNGFVFEYYNINEKFMPVFSKPLASDEYIYVVNYYGQFTNDRILGLKQRFGQIILDNTHAFFQKPLDGIDTIYSCRKFFGVPDGAYLSTHINLAEEPDMDISKDRMPHILGRYEGNASDYYSYFRNNDESLRNLQLKYMSKLTHNILGAVDYERVYRVRNENYAYLESELGRLNKLELIIPDGAFAYPFYLDNGLEVRKVLAQKKVYIPILWPDILDNMPEGSIEHRYAENILPLPCDQRYGIDDMNIIIKYLREQEGNV